MLGRTILSEDEKYRFWLERTISGACSCVGNATIEGPLFPCATCAERNSILVVIGANPSTATAVKDDQTMTKEQGFALRWGCSRLIKGNVYGFRARDPDDMWAAARRGENIHGTDGVRNNYSYIYEMVGLAINTPGSIVLGAWGNIPHRDDVRALVASLRRDYPAWFADPAGGIKCLGTNKNGSPKHTLYLPYETPRIDWTQAMDIERRW